MGMKMPMSKESKPLYSIIYEELKERIISGQYAEDQQLPTEIELAEMYGVSRITSKRALIDLERDGYIYRKRGSGSYVKKRWGQQPAHNSASGQIISMILPYVAANGLLGYMQGATDYLQTKGYYLTIHTSNWDAGKEKEFLLNLPRRGICGIILYPVSTLKNLDAVYALYMNNFPLVTIDQYYDNVPVGSVVSDNFSGAYMATTKLIEAGHRRIAFVSSIGLEYRNSVRDRFFGYCRALRDNGLPIENELIHHDFRDHYEHPEGKAFIQSLVKRLIADGVSAVQAEHDLLAVDILRSAMDIGVKVPDKLSIVGFDNHDISENVEVPITTVAQNFYEIGKSAAEIIVQLIEKGSGEFRHKTEIPVQWVERQSVRFDTKA
jgi:DNA-binding LacI/PurR family transcriptional regulator